MTQNKNYNHNKLKIIRIKQLTIPNMKEDQSYKQKFK